MNKELKSLLLAIVAIIIMVSPAIAINEIDKSTTANIMAFEGLYSDGVDILALGEVDKDAAEWFFDIETVVGSDANNDSLLMNELTDANDKGFYGNYITYTGNGTHIATIDYTNNPHQTTTPNTIARYLAIPMDISGSELSQYDFIRIESSYDCEYYLVAEGDIYPYLFHSSEHTANQSIWINTLTSKSILNDNPDEPIWLQIGSKDLNQLGEDEPAIITFKLEAFNLEPVHQLSMETTTQYFLAIAIADVVMIVMFAFTTQWIDIKFDKSKK